MDASTRIRVPPVSAAECRQERERPRPRHQAQRHFKAARPVDANADWVGIDPVVHRRDRRGRIALLAGQRERLRQLHGPLVPAQFPHHLAVANQRGIERVNRAPMQTRCAASVDRVEMPVDGVAEGQVLITEQIKVPAQHAFGLREQRAARLGELLADHRDARPARRRQRSAAAAHCAGLATPHPDRPSTAHDAAALQQARRPWPAGDRSTSPRLAAYGSRFRRGPCRPPGGRGSMRVFVGEP